MEQGEELLWAGRDPAAPKGGALSPAWGCGSFGVPWVPALCSRGQGSSPRCSPAQGLVFHPLTRNIPTRLRCQAAEISRARLPACTPAGRGDRPKSQFHIPFSFAICWGTGSFCKPEGSACRALERPSCSALPLRCRRTVARFSEKEHGEGEGPGEARLFN